MAYSLSLYNQSILGDDDFIASFVARHALLETLFRRLRTTEPAHYVLIGPRGMGKTSLLRRLAIGIMREPELAACYVPLSFREEQYNVLSLGDFWRNCGESLAEWAEATGQTDLAHRLDVDLSTDAWADNDTSSERFSAELESLHRRAILFLDNIDLILDGLSSDSNWRLRRHLQARQGPIVIGAATQPLSQSADKDAAFYEFFEPVYLEPLDEYQTEGCMRALAHRRGSEGDHVLKVLDTQPERLKTLHALTGGNPRVLTLIYQLLEAGQSEAAMADLERLLDQVTPYYKARVEEYQTPQQRAVIDAVALNWDPITTAEVSRVTNIASTTLSPLLIRLRKEGLLEIVETSGSYAGHQIVERFFNIWYLMRHGTRRIRQKMRWLVTFLTSFYSLDELADLARRADDKGLRKAWRPDYAWAFNEALEHMSLKLKANDAIQFPELEIARPTELESVSLKGKKVKEDVKLIDAAKLVRQASELFLARDYLSCIKILDKIITIFDHNQDRVLRKQVAWALGMKGAALGLMGNSRAEITAYDEILVRFRNAEELELREEVVRALVNKGITLGQIGDNAAAVAVYDEVEVQFGSAVEMALHEQVARALTNKAVALGWMGNNAIALSVYDEVRARFGNADETALREQVAMALFNKAITLSRMGDNASAVSVYDEIRARFGDAQESTLRGQVAMALVNKAATLGWVSDHAAALIVYDEVLARFDISEDPTLREQVAMALVNKATTLGRIGDHAAAVAIYDEVLARFGNTQTAALRRQVAISLVNKAITVGWMGDHTAAVAIYDEVLARFGNTQTAALRRQVATALVNKAATLAQMGDHTAAVAIYDEVLARFKEAEEPAVREQVVKALVNKAATLAQMGDHAAAVAVCDATLARIGDAGESSFGQHVAMVLGNKAAALAQMGDHLAAVTVYDEVFARFGNAEESALREQVAMALVNKAITLRRMGETAAAMSTFEQMIGLSDHDSTPLSQTQLARARIALAGIVLDFEENFTLAKTLYLEAAVTEPVVANANLAWLYVLANHVEDAVILRKSLGELPACGLALLDGAIKLASDNFGSATDDLALALGGEFNAGKIDFSEDLDRLLRLAEKKGYGERLIEWFEKTGFADRVAPIYAAFKAYVRNERVLLDVNPEVRRPAQAIYERLTGPRRHKSKAMPKEKQARRRREPRK